MNNRKVTIDFESRSSVSLEDLGAWEYASSPFTEVLCLAVKVDNHPPKVWIPLKFRGVINTELTDKELNDLITSDDVATIEAHNYFFELAIWEKIMVERFNFTPLPLNKLRCSMAKALMCGIAPRLEDACNALNVTVKKDLEGAKVMRAMCRPTRTGAYNLDAFLFKKLVDYCKQDVNAEHALSEALPDLPPYELLVFQFDRRMNIRGYRVFLPHVRKLQEIQALCEPIAQEQFFSITGTNPTCSIVFRDWLRENLDPSINSTDKQTVAGLLTREGLPHQVKQALLLKAQTGNSCLAKLSKMVSNSDVKGDIRLGFRYHGASTGRWAGKGVQPQNFPREVGADCNYNMLTDKGINPATLRQLYGDALLNICATMLRKLIIPREGMQFYVGDFSAIEGRVLAWLANEEWVIEEYYGEGKMYERSASAIYKVKKEEVTKAQRTIGKVCELALGFQGAVGAFNNMAKNYGVNVSDEEATSIVSNWRKARPKTVSLWRTFSDASVLAVNNMNTTYCVSKGRVKFRYDGIFLMVRLPSGRCLYYLDPSVSRRGVEFTSDNKGGVPFRKSLYGGLLTENITQAHARDLMAYASLNLEKEGYLPCMLVHDEAICERAINTGSVEEFVKIMTKVPEWSKGLPMGAEAWKGMRYGKH